MGSRALLRDSDPARLSGRRDRAARSLHDLAAAARQLRAPSTDRAMDLAAMDVRVGAGPDRLLDAIQSLHADLTTPFTLPPTLHFPFQKYQPRLPPTPPTTYTSISPYS